MARPKKVTWDAIYRDFRMHFPNLKKRAIGFVPWTYATIMVKLDDGSKLVYNYDTKETRFIELRKE